MAEDNPRQTDIRDSDAGSATFDGKADLGVLFVHGIGRQRRGDTLLAAGGALHEWLARWFTEGNVARGTSRGVLAPLEEDPSAPAHVYTEMTQDDVTTGWWLAESWWAEAFPTPGFANLAIWAFQVMPWTLTSHFGTRARRARARLGWSSGWWKAWNTLRLALDIGLLLVSFVLLLPLVALMGLLALVGAIPIQGLRNFVGAIQRALSSSLGDSYALLTSPITEAAIEETVRRDLEWLAERSSKVAVVAHSQGAAISHAVLRGPIPANVAMFVSVGSGLNKLAELRRAREKAQPTQTTPREGPGTPYAGAVGLLLAVPAFMWLFGALPDSDMDPTWLWIAAFAGAISLAVAVQRAWVGFPPEDVDDLTLPDEIDWIDLYASADPVPNGALFDPPHPPQVAGPRGSVDQSMGFDIAVDPTARGSGSESPAAGGVLPDSAVVHNRGSLLKDHNDYWRNRDGFMGALVQELSSLCAGIDFGSLKRSDIARLSVAPRRRRWRVWWLGTVRVALMAMAALVPAVLAWRGELDEVGLPVADGVDAVLNLLPWYSTTSMSGFTTDVAAVASIVIVAYVAYFVIQWLWRWWGYVETHRLYRRLPYQGLPPQALFASATLVLAIEVGVLTATGHSSGLASAAWESAKIAGALAVLGIFALAIGDRGLEGLWRKLPGGRSLIGAPGVVTTARVSFYVMFVVLVMFVVYAAQAVNGWDPQDVTAVFYVTAAVGAMFPTVWNARPLYEIRRSTARWSYAGEVNLAQLRHAAPEAQRRLLDDAIEEMGATLDAANRLITLEHGRSPELGEAGRWRSAARIAHETARDAVDVYCELDEVGAGEAAFEVLEKAAAHCAFAAVTHVEARGLGEAGAAQVLEPLTKTGPRRDRRIARRALRRLEVQ